MKKSAQNSSNHMSFFSLFPPKNLIKKQVFVNKATDVNSESLNDKPLIKTSSKFISFHVLLHLGPMFDGIMVFQSFNSLLK